MYVEECLSHGKICPPFLLVDKKNGECYFTRGDKCATLWLSHFVNKEKNDDETDEMYGGVFVLDLLLTAALIAGNVSCSQPAGGNTYVPDGGYNGGNGDQTGDDKEQGGNGGQTGGNEQGGTIGGGTGTGGNENTDPADPVTPPVTPKYPDYYINEEFGGQRFVEYVATTEQMNTDWFYNENRNNEFTTRYNNAIKFMNDKVADLQKDISGQTNNTYYRMINTALQKYNSKQNISDNIDANYTALAPFFKSFIDESTGILTDEEFYDYQVSHDKLAYNAYENSISSFANTPTFQSYQDMRSDIYPNNFFAQELVDSHYNYNTLTLAKAKEVMNNTLAIISKKTNTNTAILKKVVELVMYNESLYGLNDFATAVGVKNQTLRHQHSIADFSQYIDSADINNLNSIQNIDDGRTM